MTGGRITPTGVLVQPAGDVAPLSADWFAGRRQGITATDIPKILGLSKYGNALSVWRDKLNTLESEASEAAYWGTVLEEPVARRWAEQHSAPVHPVGTLANSKLPWMLASLDRLVPICPDERTTCGLEVKTRSAYVAGNWREEVPDDVLAQVQWQLMVSGLPHAHVACLLGGQRLVQFTVMRDSKLEAYLMDAAAPVWDAVQSGTPPEVSADAEGVLLAELNKMFADREGAVIVDETEADLLIDDYRAGHRKETAGKKVKAIAKGNMVKLMGGAEVATDADHVPLWTYKKGEPTDTITADELRRLQADLPGIYDSLVAQGYITKTNPKPRFDLK